MTEKLIIVFVIIALLALLQTQGTEIRKMRDSLKRWRESSAYWQAKAETLEAEVEHACAIIAGSVTRRARVG